MERWLNRRRISRNPYLPKSFTEICLLFMAIWMNVLTTSYGQQTPEGFLSIGCGSPSNFTDDVTALDWVTDVNSEYIRTGNSSMSLNRDTNVTLDSELPNRPALLNFRFFPERRSKFCYELPTTPNTTYLLRLSFVLDIALVKSLPIQFVVAVNATTVVTMTYTSDIAYNDISYLEGIFHSPGGIMNICLQPLIGTPFISSLELRPLDPAMYSYSGSDRQYLANLVRWNIGASTTAPAVIRYPDDLYDRFWYTPASGWIDLLPNLTAPIPPDSKPRPDVNNVPPKVMQDAWGGLPFWVAFNLYPTPPIYVVPGEYAYVAVYAEQLNESSPAGILALSLDDIPGQSINVSSKASMQVTPNFILSSSAVNVSMDPAEPLEFWTVTMNAVEVYAQYNFNFSTTTPEDDAAISTLKTSFFLNDWQGDPCLPVPHDWLSCSISYSSFATPLQQPCGSGTDQCDVRPGFLRSTYSVTALNLSNLPTVGFSLLQTNVAASRLAQRDLSLNALTEMTMRKSGVDGLNFQFLLNDFSGPMLTLLDLSQNAIDSLPVASGWPQLEYLVSLNLSRNLLSGVMNSFEDAPFVNSLQKLDLSYNVMTSLPNKWRNTTKTLVVLDLSHNKLGGDISTLDSLVMINVNSLRELYVSNNKLTGSFFGPLYFAGLPNLTVANFDRNSIQGTLNLTSWFEALQSESDTPKNSTPVTQKLFSFVNNSISNIVPKARALEAVVNSLRKRNPSFTNKGILLGGNPYCKGATSSIQLYLCRFTVEDVVNINKNDHDRDILIISICVGVIVLLLSCTISVTIWKLWKQVYALRGIQQALADQKVQPPFFQYSDLKSATSDFHKDNKLGQGGFGIVYKGVLSDKTSLAVKRLFNSQKIQVLNEFLNEVVLITGIKHRNLVQLKGCCMKDKERMLVYEYVEKGNLAEALWGSKVHGWLNWEQRYGVCVGIARGLSYLHEELQPSVIHRDIKPENILLNKNFQPKIADFGLARHISDESSQAMYTQIAGTLGYFSPEYATEGQISDKVDVYSYGIVVLEIVSGRKCIDHSLPDERKYLRAWVCEMHGKGLLLDVLQPELRDSCVVSQVIRAINIGLQCVQQDPQRRPSMSQVVTMLLGNVDVEVPMQVFFQESEHQESAFNQLSVLVSDQQLENHPFQTAMQEDFPDIPLAADYVDFESSSRGTSGKENSRPFEKALVGR